MMPLTADVPKAMAPYRGSTLLRHSLEVARRQVSLVHVTVGYRKAMLASHAIEHGAASVFNTEGQMNAWWIRNTFLSFLDEPVVVLTCDGIGELDLAIIAAEYERLKRPACMLVPIAPVAGLDGDYIRHDRNGTVLEVSRTAVTRMFASGIQVLNPSRVCALSSIQADNFADVWRELISHRELKACALYPRCWRAFDTVEQLRVAELAEG